MTRIAKLNQLEQPEVKYIENKMHHLFHHFVTRCYFNLAFRQLAFTHDTVDIRLLLLHSARIGQFPLPNASHEPCTICSQRYAIFVSICDLFYCSKCIGGWLKVQREAKQKVDKGEINPKDVDIKCKKCNQEEKFQFLDLVPGNCI